MAPGRSRSQSQSPGSSKSGASPRKHRRQRHRSGSAAQCGRRRRAKSRTRSRSRSRSASSKSGGGRRAGRRKRASPAARSPSSDVESDGEARCRIWVAHADCARIIGRKGEARMDIERQSEASLRVQREEEMEPGKKERSIELIGKTRQRKRALKLVLKVASFVRDDSGNVLKDQAPVAGGGNCVADTSVPQGEVLQIAGNEIGRVLGRGGENIRRIEDESGARLELDRAEGRLQIRGGPEAVAKAKEMVLADVSHARAGDGSVIKDDLVKAGAGTARPNGGPSPPGTAAACGGGGSQPFKLWVHSREAGRVIGRGGETVRDLMQRTGCEIQVERTSGGEQPQSERLIQLFGPLPQVREAFTCIARDIAYVRGEAGVLKSSEMTPQEAEEMMRLHGPGGIGTCAVPGHLSAGGMPPGMLRPPGMMPPMGMMGMMGAPPGMTGPMGPMGMLPPQAMMMPGMMHPPGMMPPPGMMGPPPGQQGGCMHPPGGGGGMPPRGPMLPPGGAPMAPANDAPPPQGGGGMVQKPPSGQQPVAGGPPGGGCQDGVAAGSFNAPWNSKRPIEDWDEL